MRVLQNNRISGHCAVPFPFCFYLQKCLIHAILYRSAEQSGLKILILGAEVKEKILKILREGNSIYPDRNCAKSWECPELPSGK